MRYLLSTIFIFFLLYPITVSANRGCCSRHGGVSYCGNNGYYICNDGSQSPSCICTTYEIPNDNDYNNEILNSNTCNTKDLENKISKLEKDVEQFKSDSNTYRALFWITFVILIIYYFYKQADD